MPESPHARVAGSDCVIVSDGFKERSSPEKEEQPE
jgi:hypothetical protein